MRFGLVHRVMTDALAALGVLALVASGQFNRVVNIAVVIGLVLAVAMKETWRHQAANRHVDTVAVFALVAAQLGRAFFSNASVLDLLIEFAVGLQIIRVATRKGAAHDQQVIVLALLHLIAGTVVGGGLGYGLCFFGLLVVTPGALVLSHLRREVEGNYRQGARDRTGLPVDVPRILRSKRVVGRQFIAVTCMLSVPILLFTVALFIVFPRVGLSLLLLNRPKQGHMIGFSDKVDLGQIGTLRTDPTIALRVTIPDLPKPPPARKVMHLRGTALDHYDGGTWSKSSKLTRTVASGGDLVPVSAMPDVGKDPLMRLELEPIEPPVLFLPRFAKGLRLRRSATVGPGSGVHVQRGAEGEYRYQAPNDRGTHYEVYMSKERRATFPHLRHSERDRYLQLPKISERIHGLAKTWTANKATDYERARAIERRLRTEYRYDLTMPSGDNDDPLDHFLFVSKRGHCEFYSTAMAVMLRTQGIPSRNVTGFIGGTYNKFGNFYAVRQGDAHSWVEAYIEGRGWLTFDPTPPSAAVPLSEIEGLLASVRDFFEAVSQRWNRHVIGYDLRQQVSLFEQFSGRNGGPGSILTKPSNRRLIYLTVGLALIALSVWWLRRRKRKEATEEGEARKRSREEALATGLYQSLDRVMVHLGIARSAATPPLRHATALQHVGHPCAEEITSLTERYLAARFGEVPMTLDERRDFETRVRDLKSGQARKPPALPEGTDEPEEGEPAHAEAEPAEAQPAEAQPAESKAEPEDELVEDELVEEPSQQIWVDEESLDEELAAVIAAEEAAEATRDADGESDAADEQEDAGG